MLESTSNYQPCAQSAPTILQSITNFFALIYTTLFVQLVASIQKNSLVKKTMKQISW